MPSDIFLFPAIWLAAAAGSFLRYLNRGPKMLFFSNKFVYKVLFTFLDVIYIIIQMNPISVSTSHIDHENCLIIKIEK